MPKDRRCVISGQLVNFTCENVRFKTNVAKGQSHGSSAALGSVFSQPLVSYAGGTLWLEHVVDKEDPREPYYWLMHYDSSGMPTIPLSAVINKTDLQHMASLMASLIP